MRFAILYFLLTFLLVSSCTQDKMPTLIELDMELRNLVIEASPTKSTDFYVLPDGSDITKYPQDFINNALTDERVALGKLLFFETGLARDARYEDGMETYSCATCHVPEAGFKPGNFQGIADGGIGYGIDGTFRLRNTQYEQNELDVQAARPLSMVNVGFVHNTSWNGSFGATHVNIGTEDLWSGQALERNNMGMQGLETQNIDGILVHRLTYTPEVIEDLGYKEMFDAAYPEYEGDERYSTLVGSLALSAYLRTIIADQAPFQDWLKGDLDALSYEEKEGGILFFSKANCSKCHYAENLGSLEFHALGVKDMYQRASYTPDPLDKRNLGRGGFTLLEDDNFKFKVPGLYNVADTEFFFHGASHSSLSSLIEYKNKAESENPNVDNSRLSEKFTPLNLTDDEKRYLETFLRKSLTDPNLLRYKPTSILSGNCFPNNDPQSQVDIGCQ